MNELRELLERLNRMERRIGALERQERPAPVVAVYVTDAQQSFSSGVEAIVNFEDKVVDTHNAVTTGASWAFAAPLAGYYSVRASIMFNTSTAWAKTEIARLTIVAAGTQVFSASTGWDSAAAAHYVGVSCDWIGYLTAGQTIDARLFQNSGAAQTLYSTATFNRITIARVH